jgi:hypothetical protein
MKYKGTCLIVRGLIKWGLHRQKEYFSVWAAEIRVQIAIERDAAIKDLQRMGRHFQAVRIVKELRRLKLFREMAAQKCVSASVYEACTTVFHIRFEKSTLVVQCWLRILLANVEYTFLKNARLKLRSAIQLQRIWKGRTSRLVFSQMREIVIAAIAVIQKSWRGFFQRGSTLKGLVTIQRVWNMIQRFIPNHAATRVQTLVRQQQAISAHGEAVQYVIHQKRMLRSKEKVALHFQTHWRRYAATVQLQVLKIKAENKEGDRLEVVKSKITYRASNAVRIQKHIRRKLGLKVLASRQLQIDMKFYIKRHASRTIRTTICCHVHSQRLAREEQRRLNFHTTQIQSRWRMRSAVRSELHSSSTFTF